MTEVIIDIGLFCQPRQSPISTLETTMQGTIFIYGNDVLLLRTRRMIFEKAGYAVYTAENSFNAMLVLMNYQIDVLVLCQSVDDGDRGKLLAAASRLQPEIRFAVLSFDGRDVVTDGVLIYRGLDGPPSLLRAIGRMLGQKTATARGRMLDQSDEHTHGCDDHR